MAVILLDFCSSVPLSSTAVALYEGGSSVFDRRSLVRRKGDADTRCVHDRATQGIFSKDTWARLLREAGFIGTFEEILHSEFESGTYIGIISKAVGRVGE